MRPTTVKAASKSIGAAKRRRLGRRERNRLILSPPDKSTMIDESEDMGDPESRSVTHLFLTFSPSESQRIVKGIVGEQKKTLVFTRRTHFTNFSRLMSVKCQSGLSSQVSYPAKRILFKKSKIIFFLALRFLFLKNSEKERQCRRGRIHATTDDSPPSYRTPDLRNKIQPLQ